MKKITVLFLLCLSFTTFSQHKFGAFTGLNYSYFTDGAAGQVLAEHIKPGDLNINAVEMKKLTNHRASGSDDSVRITPKIQFTLEECMEYIQQDECIEVTPKSVRMRKTHLDENDRKNASRSNG